MNPNQPIYLDKIIAGLFRTLWNFLRDFQFGKWWRSLLEGNPFYIISAGMMLYGLYLVSIDPQMAGEELSQLAFNFSSLQLYEVLLVVTAVVLARREIHYDSTLLVVLENMFVLVPFILVSQAALLNPSITWAICLGGCAFAVLKFVGLKHYFKGLNLPTGLLIFGAGLLLVNLAFPLWFRQVIEDNVEAWKNFSPWLWFLILPLFTAFANFLPRPRHWGGLPAQRSWLPQLFLFLWLAVTAVHVAAMDYVDNQKFQYFRLAPVLWACLWTASYRLGDFTADPSALLRKGLLVAPLFITLLAATGKELYVFAGLTALNAAIYGVLYAKGHERVMTRQLFFISFSAILAGLPEAWGELLVPEFGRGKALVLALAAYAFILATSARQARYAVLGAVVTWGGTLYQFGRMDYAEQFAMQAGFLYVLLHSLRWIDPETRGARPLRLAMAGAWVLHSFVWSFIGGLSVAAPVVLSGLLVLGICYLVRRMEGGAGSRLLVHAAWLNIAMVPLAWFVDALKIMPKGYLTVLGSFVLFAAGTAFALTREKWARRTPEEDGGKAEPLDSGVSGETVV